MTASTATQSMNSSHLCGHFGKSGLALALSRQTDRMAISSATVWAEYEAAMGLCLCRRDAQSTLPANHAEQGKMSGPRPKTGDRACCDRFRPPGNSSFLPLFPVQQSIPCYSTDQGINSKKTGSSIALNRAEAHHSRRSGKSVASRKRNFLSQSKDNKRNSLVAKNSPARAPARH